MDELRPRSGDRRTLLFYTSNGGKLAEVRTLLAPLGYTVAWKKGVLLEPQAETLEEVARAKLAQVPPGKDRVLVEDSGLFIPRLGGFPGVYSSYVLGTLGLEGILRLVEGGSREAEFRAVVALREGRETHLFTGRVRGHIAPAPRGKGGFGYDPIFLPEGKDRTTAEMTAAEKNALSHRGRALRKLVHHLSP